MLENRVARPGTCPIHENADSFHAFSQPADITLLSYIVVSGEQEREQVQTVHLFSQNPGCGCFVKAMHRLQHVPSFIPTLSSRSIASNSNPVQSLIPFTSVPSAVDAQKVCVSPCAAQRNGWELPDKPEAWI